jgi:hypothetical protein
MIFFFFSHKSLERLLLISSRGTLRTFFRATRKEGGRLGARALEAEVDLLVMGGNIALR